MTFKRVITVAAAAVLAAACSDGTSPSGDRTVSLSFTSGSTGGALLNRSAMLDDTLTAGGDVLVISRAQIVLREIELKRENDDFCESGELDDDGCEEFETGPMLIDLPLGGAVNTVITIPVDTGTYDEIDFELHKPEDDGDSADATFLAQHPEFEKISVRVQGTFNGTPFVYTTDINVEQEQELLTPLVITDSTTSTNVTLLVDVSTWFRTAAGGLINPATGNKGGANESVVNENIKKSFKAFKDDDRDGDDSDED